MTHPQPKETWPPRRILTRESRTERAAWAFTDQRPIDPNDRYDTRDEYLSLEEHAALLRQARAEVYDRIGNQECGINPGLAKWCWEQAVEERGGK